MGKIIDTNGKKIDPRKILYFYSDIENNQQVINYGYFDNEIPSENKENLDVSKLKRNKVHYSRFERIVSMLFRKDPIYGLLEKMPKIFSIDFFIENTNLKTTYYGGTKRVKAQLRVFKEDVLKFTDEYFESNLSNEINRKCSLYRAKHPDGKKEKEETLNELNELYRIIDEFINKNIQRYQEEKERGETTFTTAMYKYFLLLDESREERSQENEIGSLKAHAKVVEEFVKLTNEVNQPLDEESQLKFKKFLENSVKNYEDLFSIFEIAKEAEELMERKKVKENSTKLRVNYNNGNSIILDYKYFVEILTTKVMQDSLKEKSVKEILRLEKILKILIIVLLSFVALRSLLEKTANINLEKVSENIDDLTFNPKTVYVSKSKEYSQIEFTMQKTAQQNSKTLQQDTDNALTPKHR